jgi:hypothetical protein
MLKEILRGGLEFGYFFFMLLVQICLQRDKINGVTFVNFTGLVNLLSDGDLMLPQEF